jgi:thiamine pyrophosphate-dependent acetolactate synthase large subunit-like protein
MRRAEAVEKVVAAMDDRLLVVCNGMIGREVFTYGDRPENFYMIGSMGLALSIGYGLAQSLPDRKVVVLDGDGNVLMGAGVLASVGAAGFWNLHHIVLDNHAHGSTGDQRTITEVVDLTALALAAGYEHAERVEPADLEAALPAFLDRPGPGMLLVKVEKGNQKGIGRVTLTPQEITQRFATAARA